MLSARSPGRPAAQPGSARPPPAPRRPAARPGSARSAPRSAPAPAVGRQGTVSAGCPRRR